MLPNAITLSLGHASAERFLFLGCGIHIWTKCSLRVREGAGEATPDMSGG